MKRGNQRPSIRLTGLTACLVLLAVMTQTAALAQTESGNQTVSESMLLEKLRSDRQGEGVTPLGSTVLPESYVVGPFDGFGLNVWMSPPLEYRMDVTPEGTLIVPTVGEIPVSGLTLEEVKKRVIPAVKRRYASLDVTLTLLRPRPILVTVKGTVLHEGLVTLTATDRADRAIQIANTMVNPEEAGALKEVGLKASKRHISVRHLDGTQSRADISRYLATGNDRDNPYLREGDVIVVPDQKLVSETFGVYGEVNAPGRFEHVRGDRLLDAIRMAQGFTDYANTDSVEISRLSGDGRTMTSRFLSIDTVTGGSPDNFLIQPGDRIIVRKIKDPRADYRVQVEGEVNYPGMYPITRDRTRITDVIALAGGFTEFASLQSATLIRRSVDPLDVETERMMSFRGGITPEDSLDYILETNLRLKKEIVNVDFEKLFGEGDTSMNVFLQTNDIIRVPAISRTIYVFGQVVTPGHIPFRKGENAAYYVGMAGGFTDRARKDDLRVIKSRTKQWLAPDETDVEEGDYIWVPREPDRSFTYYMTVASQAATVLSVVVGMAAVIISLNNN